MRYVVTTLPEWSAIYETRLFSIVQNENNRRIVDPTEVLTFGVVLYTKVTMFLSIQ